MSDNQADPPLDIAVSTAQNWANVQSILGRPGPIGAVLWIESPLAREKEWSRWSSELLVESGCQGIFALEDEGAAESDPAAFQRQVSEALTPFRSRDIHLHLNGGTKLMQVALVDLLGQEVALHYCAHGLHHTRPQGGNWLSQESQLALTFEALLFAYGFEHRDKEDAQYPDLVWMFEQYRKLHFAENVRRIGAVKANTWITDNWKTFRRHYRWAHRVSGAESFTNVLEWAEQPGALVAFQEKNQDNKANPTAARARWEAFLADMKRLRVPSETRSPGDAFEARVSMALNALAPEFKVQHSASNLQIFSKGGTAPRAEIDHGWLLPGGVIWVFESKVGLLDRKDLEARKSAYSQCLGSAVEKLFLVFPEDSPRADQLKGHAQALGLTALPVPGGHEAAVDAVRRQLRV